MNSMTALPEGLSDALRDLYALSGDPVHIESPEMLIMILDAYLPEYKEWGTDERSKSVSVLVKELLERECSLSLITYGDKKYILRDIETATLYVTSKVHRPTDMNPNHLDKLWLREHHRKGDKIVYREHHNSMSEKRNLDHESFFEAAVRALRQELSLDPKPEHLLSPYLFPMSEYPTVHQVVGIENIQKQALPSLPDVRRTGRYPGTLTRNKLEHFIWDMPDEYFKPLGYQEPKTNHYFEWTLVGSDTQPSEG
jgi:hypothetical protein